ncbi:hypothetical protein BDV28DRAFT_156723 [Aspergillus coremiiformis]|uniref:AttH domain-containing protein n=1 Tax=Aspergillus coremiiformis TaxID=138285 RepID=A0A5N6ZAM4_9EURO|nr:hypothetical protein BDV28DRAFT_156723 [Aspergillus coremiiformis]
MDFLVGGLVVSVSLLSGVFGFQPEMDGLQYEQLTKPIQLTQELGASQGVNRKASNSWWSSSFVHASDDHDYLILAHAALPNPNTSSVLFRGSILDINDTTYYRQVSWIFNQSSGAAPVQEGPLKIDSKNYGFVSVDPARPLGAMRTWCVSESVEFNVTFALSTPVILNGGVGTFPFGNEETLEWSMPAGSTNGHLVRNGKSIDIDNARSLTWYDRQLMWPLAPMGGSAKASWTWFELHVEKRKMSVWIWDTFDHQRFQFATIRETPGIHQVVAVTGFTPSRREWTSPISKSTYPLDWDLSLADGTTLKISSVRDDQELCNPEGTLATYEGYVTVTGRRGKDPISGYGLVEIVPANMIKRQD